MKREETTQDLRKRKLQIDVNEEPIVISKVTMDLLMKEKNFSDLLGLYCFYYYTAKWQNNNQVFALNSYSAKKLHCSDRKIKRLRKTLIDLGLIKSITTKDSDGTITGHYVRIKFIWAKPDENNVHQAESVQRDKNAPGGKMAYHIPITNKENIPKTNNKNIIVPSDDFGPHILSIKERNERYFPLAKKLSEIINQKIKITHTKKQLGEWANDFRILREQNDVQFKRMKSALDWLEENLFDKFTPVIQSGNSFRLKFEKLEAAMERSKTPYQNKPSSGNGFRSGKSKPEEEENEITIVIDKTKKKT